MPELKTYDVADRLENEEEIGHYLAENMRSDQKLFYAGRQASAAPAGGYLSKHNERQKALMEQAFGKYR